MFTSGWTKKRMDLMGRLPEFMTKQLVKQTLESLPNSDIKTMSLKVSLICPLTKTRITSACRPFQCKHVQCFDALFYLQMNESKVLSDWKCPICWTSIRITDLIIDKLFDKILKSVPISCNKIVFNEKGEWRSSADSILSPNRYRTE